MTNSFFQTRVYPDDVKFMVVMMLFGLYGWVVMPMGCRNALVTHQRWMNQALQKCIGHICHIHLDNIVIWSNSVDKHRDNVQTILQALLSRLDPWQTKFSLLCQDIRNIKANKYVSI